VFPLVFAIIPSACNRLDLESDEDEQSRDMPVILLVHLSLCIFRFVRLFIAGILGVHPRRSRRSRSGQMVVVMTRPSEASRVPRY
jgi:hypothetical protein